MAPLALVVWLCLGAAVPSHAGDSCCAKAAAAVGGGDGVHMVQIPDLAARQPEDWDEEEDGPWERPITERHASAFEIFRKELLNAGVDASPWLLLGLLCTALLQAFQPSAETLQRHLAGRGFVVVAKGAVLGLLVPLCSCGALPLAMGLAAAGAAAPAIIAFLVASQSAGLDSLLFTVGVLGPAAAAWRMLAAALVAIAAGLSAPVGHRPEAAPSCAGKKEPAQQQGSLASRVCGGMHGALTTGFDEVAVSVTVGFALTAALTAVLPSGGLGLAAAFGGVGGRAAVLAAALPMQFCEHAAVPLAVALQNAGASGGLAFATLATMPSVNLAAFGVVAALAGPAAIPRVAISIWICGFAGSFAADWIGIQVVPVGDPSSALPEWYEQASRWVMGAIAVGAVFRLLLRSVSQRQNCCGDAKACKAD